MRAVWRFLILRIESGPMEDKLNAEVGPLPSDLDFVFAFNSSIRKAFELIRELTTAPPPNRNFPSADNSCATTGAILFPVFVGVVLVAVVANGFTEQIKGTGKWK